MAKNFTTGLPDSFNLKVTSQDLLGEPLPGYLDDDPVLELAKARQRSAALQQQEAGSKEEKIVEFKKVEEKPAEVNLEAAIKTNFEASPIKSFIQAPPIQEEKPAVKRPAPRRLQINLTPDAERKAQELLAMLSSQSPQQEIKISELMQALIINLYEARGEINISRLPQRGRWGSPMAKAFPVSLAESLREALVEHDKKSGGNPFKKAVGE